VRRSVVHEARAGMVTVDGLEEGLLYDFKVFSRNRQMDAWENLASDVVSARPLRPASAVRDVSVVEINDTSVRLAFTRPEVVVAMSGYRISRLPAPESQIGTIPTDEHSVLAEVSTHSTGFEHVFAYVHGLQEGQSYHLAVQAVNPGGGGAPARLTVRPFGKATGPEGFAVRMASSTATSLSWRPPADLGQPNGLHVYGYEVVAALPPGALWGEAGTHVVPVGSSAVSASSDGLSISHALDNATTMDMEGKLLTYGVYALVEQDTSLGGGRVRGSVSIASVLVGQKPKWSGETPQDGELLIAWIGQTVMVPLEVSDAGLATGETVRFELLGAMPPQTALGARSPAGELVPGHVELDVSAATARSYLTLRGTVQLAGSRYRVCVRAIDTTNLTADTRCYDMQIPRPMPQIISPPNNSSYSSAVGCRLVVPLVAQDRTSLDLPPALGADNGYGVSIQALYTFTNSQYKSVTSEGLPMGAALLAPSAVDGINVSGAAGAVGAASAGAAASNPAASYLEWVARKGQEGFLYRLCLVAVDSSKAFNSISSNSVEPGQQKGGASENLGEVFCVNVAVQRCRYCPRELDSLHSIAKAWHGAWLEVWSGNHMYDTPDNLPNFDVSPPLQSPAPLPAPAAPSPVSSTPVAMDPANDSFNPLEVGVVYSVESQDDLWHIAQRFGVDMDDILFWNPDLADGQAKQQQYKLFSNQELCLLPPTCVYGARVTHQAWDATAGSSSGSFASFSVDAA